MHHTTHTRNARICVNVRIYRTTREEPTNFLFYDYYIHFYDMRV